MKENYKINNIHINLKEAKFEFVKWKQIYRALDCQAYTAAYIQGKCIHKKRQCKSFHIIHKYWFYTYCLLGETRFTNYKPPLVSLPKRFRNQHWATLIFSKTDFSNETELDLKANALEVLFKHVQPDAHITYREYKASSEEIYSRLNGGTNLIMPSHNKNTFKVWKQKWLKDGDNSTFENLIKIAPKKENFKNKLDMLKAYISLFEGKTPMTEFEEPLLKPFKGLQAVLFSKIDYENDIAVALRANAFRDWWIQNGNKPIHHNKHKRWADVILCKKFSDFVQEYDTKVNQIKAKKILQFKENYQKKDNINYQDMYLTYWNKISTRIITITKDDNPLILFTSADMSNEKEVFFKAEAVKKLFLKHYPAEEVLIKNYKKHGKD